MLPMLGPRFRVMHGSETQLVNDAVNPARQIPQAWIWLCRLFYWWYCLHDSADTREIRRSHRTRCLIYSRLLRNRDEGRWRGINGSRMFIRRCMTGTIIVSLSAIDRDTGWRRRDVRWMFYQGSITGGGMDLCYGCIDSPGGTSEEKYTARARYRRSSGRVCGGQRMGRRRRDERCGKRWQRRIGRSQWDVPR